MKQSVVVRHVQSADRAEWVRMLRALYPGESVGDLTPPVDAFLTDAPISEHIPAAVFVAECAGEDGLCGFIEVSVRNYAEGCVGDTPFIESWFLDETMRGQGIARALMAAAEEWAREQGYREIASNALIDNVTSLRAHHAVGFEEVERTVNFRKQL